LGLSAAQAEAIADWLLAPRPANGPAPAPANEAKPGSAEKRPPRRPKTSPPAPSGEQLFLSLGCLACHSWRALGASGWLGGGDLTRVADKRPADFFAAWLADPARLNADHRMPVFALSEEERAALASFLAQQKSDEQKRAIGAGGSAGRSEDG